MLSSARSGTRSRRASSARRSISSSSIPRTTATPSMCSARPCDALAPDGVLVSSTRGGASRRASTARASREVTSGDSALAFYAHRARSGRPYTEPAMTSLSSGVRARMPQRPLAVYPGLVRPADQRSRGYHRARRAALRSDHRRDSGERARRRRCSRRPSGSRWSREVFARTADVEVETFDGLLVDYADRRQAQRLSCAGCERSRTSNTSSRWR